MNTKITDFSVIKQNDILKAVRKGEPACYCIVKFCHREPDIGAIWGWMSPSAIQKINEVDHRHIVMVEFDPKSTVWDLTLPVKNADESEPYIASLIEPDQKYEFFHSDIEEVKTYLKDMKNEEIGNVFEKATNEMRKIRKHYGEIINKTMYALALGDKTAV